MGNTRRGCGRHFNILIQNFLLQPCNHVWKHLQGLACYQLHRDLSSENNENMMKRGFLADVELRETQILLFLLLSFDDFCCKSSSHDRLPIGGRPIFICNCPPSVAEWFLQIKPFAARCLHSLLIANDEESVPAWIHNYE